jgi:hypothetical protein
MPKLKAQNTNWLESAWRTAEVLADLPDRPTDLPLLSYQSMILVLAQDEIALHLTYRMTARYKYKPDGRSDAFIHVEHRDPAAIARAYTRTGLAFDAGDAAGVLAQAYLARIVQDRFVCKEWRWQLPLMIASIGGQSLGALAILKSPSTRQSRKCALELEKHRLLKANSGLAWKELLTQLEGDGLVNSWDAQSIHWWDGETLRKTQTSTFRNWKVKTPNHS